MRHPLPRCPASSTTGPTHDVLDPVEPKESGVTAARTWTRCKARSTTSGEQCKKPATPGTTVCASHGSRAPQVRAKAAQRVAAEKVLADVTATLAHEGLVPVGDPMQQLAILATEALAFKRALAARVNALSSVSYESTATGTEQLRAEVALYERALDRSARFLDALVKSGFEERRVRLAEDQGLLVAGVIRRILGRLDLTAAQLELVPTVVPAELRALEAGGPA